MKTYSVIVIGTGSRGRGYTDIMKNFPDKFKVVGVAETVESRRESVKKLHGISDDMCFESWEEVFKKPKMADMVIIATLDDMHYEPCMKAIELGYDILLEKPVAPTPKECADIALAAKNKGVKVLVCHVLRYTPFYKKVKQIIMDGTIGDVMSVIAVEAVGNVHQSHSYVRGNWHSEEKSAPMLLAKSCHDIDIIQWLLAKPCKKVTSFGELTYFKEENAPEGAPKRCIDGGCPIEDTCPYNVKKLYVDDKENLWFRGASTKGFAKGDIPTDDEVIEALNNTDYGLCVFRANNDVVDHQVVNMEFEGGVTVSFTMNAFNKGGRYIRLFGTKGELWAYAEDSKIKVYTFDDLKETEIPIAAAEDESIVGGHGGGDEGIIGELYEYLGDDYQGFTACDVDISVKNHLIVFAAEKARRNETVENVDKYFEEFGLQNN